ncbi:MAG: TSUP family transporter, partial [Pseudonocardia sp.]|nr:TSUP family transporter [Pseudonocardia sp.]
MPWLLAFATLVLAFGRALSRLLNAALHRTVDMGPRSILAGQFLLAIYVGYFGGAVGILMLALWSAGLGIDAAAGNPMRVAQLAALNAVAAGIFLVAADVLADPVPLVAVLVGAVVGGFGGARLARRLSARVLRAPRAEHRGDDDRPVLPARLRYDDAPRGALRTGAGRRRARWVLGWSRARQGGSAPWPGPSGSCSR